MRSLALITSFVIATTLTSSAWAQRPYQNNFRTASYNSYKAKSTEFSVSDRLIYERALFRAHNRAARIQARKWAGISLSRPSIIIRPYRTLGNRAIFWHSTAHRTALWSSNSIR